MQEIELANEILDWIRNCYNAEYIGLLTVEKLNPGYKFTIGIPSYMFPTTIATDLNTDKEFLNFIYLELKSRNYIRQDYYRVYRVGNSNEEGGRNGTNDTPTPYIPPRRIPLPDDNGLILTSDGLNFLVTSDGLFHIELSQPL